jgi:hypothetical protein
MPVPWWAWLLGIGGAAAVGAIAVTMGKKTPPPTGFSLIVQAYNAEQVDYLANTVAPHLRPGDIVDLVVMQTGDPAVVNGWYSTLSAVLPGVEYAAHAAGLANIRTLVAGLNPGVPRVLYDYEPNFEPEFTFDFPTTLSNFEQFASIVRSAGFKAIGYPTGRGLKNGWDYGKIAVELDGVWDQTQGSLTGGISGFQTDVQKLLGQLSAQGFSPRNYDFVCQATVGTGGNAVPPALTAQAMQYLAAQGFPKGYVWWSLADEADLLTAIQLLGR